MIAPPIKIRSDATASFEAGTAPPRAVPRLQSYFFFADFFRLAFFFDVLRFAFSAALVRFTSEPCAREYDWISEMRPVLDRFA
jgi:hypothetical protein